MIPKTPYNPAETEPKILEFWHKHKFFKPEYAPRDGEVKSTAEMQQDDREPFAIICPPPNAYARPHIGNVSGYAYQDVFGRYARMHGKKTLLFPGKDHAAQEAETIYLRDVLAPQGKSKADFTREEFYAACYEYFTGIMQVAQADEKRIGLSADFDRDLFTLDPRVFETVMNTFIKMYQDGMVYKDVRIVNWSPGMQSVVADIDTARKEREAELTYIKYPLGDVDEIAIDIRNRFASQTIEWVFERSQTKDGSHDLPFSFGEYSEYTIDDKAINVIAIGYEDLNPDERVAGEVVGIQMNLSSPYRLVVKKPGSDTDLKLELEKIFEFESKYYAGAHIVLFDEGTDDDRYRNGIFVATTRPETMLGDTAVVVDPTDERYANLVGKYVYLPLTDRQIPIIANGRVDKEFGTGAVKLTPAHSADDYTMMLEWNYKKDFEHMPANVQAAREELGEVGYINIIWKDLKLVGPVGKYKGMKVNAARTQVVEDLTALGLIEKVEKITQNVVICDRTKSVIEPIMSSQWFIDVDRLKQPALEALKAGEVTIHPDNMSKKLEFWLQNLRDWPISRSIWWGYRIPVWYKGEIAENVDDAGKIVIQIAGESIADMQDAVNRGLIKVQTDSPGEGWLQDPDVFDTWFSSGQWPFATLTAENLMDTFYPTQVMETGYDILELWVSRMIMLGLYTQGKVPFKDVYLHGLINAPDGQKMSKSKGNNINIDDIIAKYGADTLRMMYIVGNKAGASYRVDFEKLEGYRRFLNKVWNAAKFVEMNMAENSPEGINPALLQFESNKKLATHIQDTHTEVTKLIDGFNIGIAAQVLFEGFWHTFCDICLEEAKPNLYPQKDKDTQAVISEPDPAAKTETQKVLYWALVAYLKMLHPFIPFVTEEIWQHIATPTDKASSLVYINWDI